MHSLDPHAIILFTRSFKCPRIPRSYWLTCARHQSISEQKVLHGGCPIQRRGVGVVNGEGQRVSDMIVKIFADTRQIVNDWYTNSVQVFSWSDTAVQKYLWRVYST